MASEADPEARLVAMVSMVPFPLPVTVTLTSVLSFFLLVVVAFTVALALPVLALATLEEAEAALRAAHTREVSRSWEPSALAALLTLTEKSAAPSRPLALEMAAKTRLGEARGSEATARRLMLVLRLSRIWLRMEAVTASAPTVWRRETRGVVSSSSWD